MITIEIDDDGVVAGLSRLAGRMEDMSPVMREIGDAVREASMESFEREAPPEGGKWPPLSPATIRRRRGGPVHRILQDTGALRQSIVKRLEGDRSVIVGARVEYAPFHQFGTRRMPARPFLGVSPTAREEIMDAIHDWLGDTA